MILMDQIIDDQIIDLREPGCNISFDYIQPETGCLILPSAVSSGTKGIEDTRDGWSHKKFLETDIIYKSLGDLNNSNNVKIKHILHEYQISKTLTGVSGGDDIDLDIKYPFELQRTNLHFSDETIKSFSVSVYGGFTGNINSIIMSYSNHYNQDYENTVSRTFLAPNKIHINVDGSILKTVEITLFLRELFQFQGD